MSYQISTRVYQSNTNAYFTVAEKTAWGYANGGRWAESNGAHVLTIGGSGTSGTLRIVSDSEAFLVALGVHNYKLWTDIQPNLNSSQTGVVLHPVYYRAGTSSSAQRRKQLSEYGVENDHGRSISIKCIGSGSQTIACNVIIV